MTDSQALQAEQLAGVIAASATAAHRRRRHGPAPRRDCGARRGDRRRGQAEARVSSPPACAPRGACLRRARLRRLRSGPASTGGAGGALVSPVALRSASQSGQAPGGKPRARPSAHASRQPRRGGCHAACTKPRPVTGLASLRLESCRGGFAAPETPRPLRPGVRAPGTGGQPCPLRAPRPRRSPWRAERQGSHRTRGTLRAHGFDPVQARRRAIPARRPRPGGPSCARPLRRGWRARVQRALAPAAAGRRDPPEAVRRPVRGVTARTPVPLAMHRGRCPSCGPSRHLFPPRGQCLGPRPARAHRPAPVLTAAPQASKGGTRPPLDPPGERPSGRRQQGARLRSAACGALTAPRSVPVLRAVPAPVPAPRPVPRPARPCPATASTPLASLRAAQARPASPGV